MTLAVCAASAQSVVPQTVNFSAMLRDSVGNVMSDTRARVRLVFLEGGAEGSTVYTTETATTTNANGYVSFQLNRNMSSYGTPFAQIPWENGDFWVRIDYKTEDMTDYISQDCIELTSNFYAFVARLTNHYLRKKDLSTDTSDYYDLAYIEGKEYKLLFELASDKANWTGFANTILGMLILENKGRRSELVCKVNSSKDGDNHFWLLKRKNDEAGK